MDGGKLEREQAKHVKVIVKEHTRRSRRTLQRGNLSQDATPDINLSSPPEASASVAVLPNSLDVSIPGRDGVASREHALYDTSDMDLARFGSSTAELHHNDGIALRDAISDNWDISLYSSNQLAALTPIISGYSSRPEPPPVAPSVPSEGCFSTPKPSNPAPSSRLTVLPIDRGSVEGTAFMHYLDHVFYIQFPFYNSFPPNAGRGWLFQLLVQNKSVYHAALALSQYHRRSILPSIDNGNEYYVIALRQLQDAIGVSQKWFGTIGLTHSVGALACSLFLLFLEVRHRRILQVENR